MQLIKETIDTPALAGSPLNLDAFRRWVRDAKKGPFVSLDEAKEMWNIKKRRLRTLDKKLKDKIV